jgi:hypothetical protein
MGELPRGLVTLVVTDIEGSTQLVHELGERYAGETPSALRARLLDALALFTSICGSKERALELSCEGVALARAAGDPATLGHSRSSSARWFSRSERTTSPTRQRHARPSSSRERPATR